MNKNVALQEDNLEKWVPQVNGKVISYDCFYIGEDTYSGTVISSFDVNKPDKTIDAKCIMNNSGEVYKDFDYEKATLVIYGNMFGSDARFAIM